MSSFKFRVDNNSNALKFQQLIEAIVDSISRNQLKQGEMLPSVNQIMKESNLSRDTVFKAYAELKKRGIVLEEFFREVIYPFFANYHFKDATGRYANGEYKHHSEGIIQFYYEEYGLENDKLILNILETSIKGVKYEPNRKCPLCGGNKYKKCCRKIVYQLRQYNKEQLSKDFRVFEQRLNLKG